MIPPPEQNAHEIVMEAGKGLQYATKEKEEADKTINIEIRKNNAEIKVLKMETRKIRAQNAKEGKT